MNQSRFSDDRSVDGASMLTSFDLGALEEMDPSLSNFLKFSIFPNHYFWLSEFQLRKMAIMKWPELFWGKYTHFLDGGFRVIYDKEVPIELRLVEEDQQENNEAGTLESIKTKILIEGEVEAPKCVKVELTSEADLFFHYTCM